MKTTYLSLFSVVLSASLLTGCSAVVTRINANPQGFAQLPPEQQALVKNAQITIGFSTEAVCFALGNPKEITTQATPAGQIQIWHYEPKGYYETEPYSGRSGNTSFWDVWEGDSPVVGPPRGSDRLRVEFLEDRVFAVEQIVDESENSFTRAPIGPDVTLSAYSGTSKIKNSNDLQGDGRRLLKNGYILLAVISCEREDQIPMGQINDEAKKLGGDFVLWSDKDVGTQLIDLTLPGFDAGVGVAARTTNGTNVVPFAIRRYLLTVTFWRKRAIHGLQVSAKPIAISSLPVLS
jgi:hypothetical protein